jgi:hypothetical protein
MSDDKKAPPDPMADVTEGLGLLLRAAKTAVDKIPTDDLGNLVTTTAEGVGRALEGVGSVIEKEIFHHDRKKSEPPAARKSEPPQPPEATAPAPADAPPAAPPPADATDAAAPPENKP